MGREVARAARQAANKSVDIESHPLVKCRVTKFGGSKVSMGIHVAAVGDAYYEPNEELSLELPIAEALEERGFVEIQ